MIGTLPDMKTAPCERCEPEQLRREQLSLELVLLFYQKVSL